MKTKLLQRGFIGFPAGVMIGMVITILISLTIHDGTYYPVSLDLIEQFGSELSAVIVQTILCGVLGAGFGCASVIWERDDWSLAKQTGIYFVTICVLMFPIAYIANWMSHTMIGIVSYVVIFVALFILIWLIQYLVWKSKIKKLNAKMREME